MKKKRKSLPRGTGKRHKSSVKIQSNITLMPNKFASISQ